MIKKFTATHWGTYVHETKKNISHFNYWKKDTSPSEFGLNFVSAAKDSLRIKQPHIRKGWLEKNTGVRGKDTYIPVSWEDAISFAAKELKRVKLKYGNESIFAGSYGWASAGRFHHAKSQLNRFFNLFGGFSYSNQSYSYAAAQTLLPHIIGKSLYELLDDHTSWQALSKKTELVLMFGGMPLKNAQISSGGVGKHTSEAGMKQCKNNGVKFVNISPQKTDAPNFLKADQIFIRPNTDTALMLSLAYLLIVNNTYDKNFIEKYTVGFEEFKKYLNPKILAPAVTVICFLAVPTVMAYQNWDDHDRSDRYTAQSMAKSYLDSIEEDAGAMLFTIGDNDTFSLWYAQEIEGYRTDVRTINTSLFATDWYIDQMRRKAYESDRIPTTLEHKNYVYGVNDAVWYQKDPRVRDTLLIKDWIKYIKSDNETTKAELRSGQIVNTFPTKNLRLPVSGSNAIEHGIVKEKDREKIAPYIDITLKGDIIYKNRLIMLDVIANNEWKRPIYFTGGSYGDDDYLWMKDYLQLDGMCYKLVPIRTPIDKRNPYDMGRIDTDKMYNIVKEWDWGNGNDPDIYHDPETRKNGLVYRSNLAKLIEELIKEKDFERAEEMLDLGMEQMPVDYYGFYTLLEPFISGYYEIGKPKKARDIWRQVATKYQENLTYYSGFKESRQFRYAEDIITDIERYRSLVDILIIYQDEELVKPEAEKFNNYLRLFRHFYGEDEEMNPEEELTPEEQQYIEGFEQEFGTETTPKIDSVNNLDSIN